jgi:hypothetical protein
MNSKYFLALSNNKRNSMDEGSMNGTVVMTCYCSEGTKLV